MLCKRTVQVLEAMTVSSHFFVGVAVNSFRWTWELLLAFVNCNAHRPWPRHDPLRRKQQQNKEQQIVTKQSTDGGRGAAQKNQQIRTRRWIL